MMLRTIKCLSLGVLFGLGTLPMAAQAGFLDSIYDVQNAIGSIGRTADVIRGSKQSVDNLNEEVGINKQQQAVPAANVATGQLVTGAVLAGKLKNTTLQSMPDKTSAPVAILNKQDVMIYMGTQNNGYLHVQSDKGEGWVAAPLVAVQ